MPRYFFHLSNRDILLEDCEGKDLPDLQTALDEVLKVHQKLGSGLAEAYGLEFVIADRQGHTLLRVPVLEGHQTSSSPVMREAIVGERRVAAQAASGYLH